MHKIVSLIIVALFVAIGTTLASGVSIQSDRHGCRSAMPMDCCAGIFGRADQLAGKMDCCAMSANEAGLAQVILDLEYYDPEVTDCGNSFCRAPSQPSGMIVKNPRHFSDGGVLPQLHYSKKVPLSELRAGSRILPHGTGSPVPLYMRHCALRY